MKDTPMKQNAMRSIQPKVLRRVVVTIEGFVIRGGLEEMDNICYQKEQGRRKHRKKLRAG